MNDDDDDDLDDAYEMPNELILVFETRMDCDGEARGSWSVAKKKEVPLAFWVEPPTTVLKKTRDHGKSSTLPPCESIESGSLTLIFNV